MFIQTKQVYNESLLDICINTDLIKYIQPALNNRHSDVSFDGFIFTIDIRFNDLMSLMGVNNG
jgi:hypothetical protein